MNIAVSSYCIINKGEIIVNGQKSKIEEGSIDDKLSTLYKNLGVKYSKFYKMDRLSKLGIIGVENICQTMPGLNKYKDDEIAMLFMNIDSSLDSDSKHQKMLDENRNPSPAIFVYTLPNIVMGEISIFKKWYGENLFILADHFSLKDWLNEVQLSFESNKAKALIGGWINVYDQEMDLRMFLVENNDEGKSVNFEELSNF